MSREKRANSLGHETPLYWPPMAAVDVIRRKRDGGELSPDEIISFVKPKGGFRAAGRWMIGIGALLAVPTLFSGIYAFRDVVSPEGMVIGETWEQLKHESTWNATQWVFIRRHIWLNAIATGLLCSDFLATPVDVDVNIDLSELFWVKAFAMPLPKLWIIREAPGIILGPVDHLQYPPREQGGIEFVPESYFHTDLRWRQLQRALEQEKAKPRA